MNISVFSVVVCFSVAGSVTVEAGVTYKLAILEGETQPGGAVFSDFGSAPGINQSGQILFEGAIGGSTDGLWVMSGSQLDALAVEDADVPGIPGAKFNSFSSGEEGTFLADDGRVLFSSRIKGTGITTTNDLILWSGLPGSLQVVMREGSPAPGAPTLNFVAPSTESFSDPAILREGGVLGFIGQLSGTQTLLNDQRGVWTGTAGQIAPAILSGQTSPHGNIVKVFTSSLGLAPNGDAYVGAATGPQSRGLWHARAGTLTRLYTQGQEAPGIQDAVFSLREGVTFENISFFSPDLLSFNCRVKTSEKDLVGASFSGPAAAVDLSLLEGTPAPELGGPLFFLINQAHANRYGGQVVGCTLQNGIGVTNANNNVLYYIPPGAPVAQWQFIAREGDPVPGTTNVFWGGGFFEDYIAINASGLVVFQNRLTGAGVPAGTDGIWSWDSATRALTLVAREGLPIDFGGGNVRTPLVLTFRGGTGRLNGRTSGLNDRNEIVFQAVGSDYKEMIAVATILADIRITSITRSGNTVTIQGSGVPSATHKLHATNDLLLPFDVNPIATTVADANGIFQFVDNATQARKFYRVVYP